MNTIFILETILPFLFFNSRAQIGIVTSASPIGTQQGATKPSPREGHCLVYDEQQRRVILLDGYRPPYQPALGEMWSWKGKRWELIPGSGPTARSLSSADQF